MKKAKKVYYYVLMNNKGGLLLFTYLLPIFWLKKVADEHAERFPGSTVKRITHNQLADILKTDREQQPL